MPVPSFTKKVIGTVVNPTGPGAMNTFATAGDMNSDGWMDVVVCGRNGKMVWLENRGPGRPWVEHWIDEVSKMECGGSLIDLTGNGYLDIINGSEAGHDEIYWWENPGPGKTGRWTRHLIAKTGLRQFHDTLVADVTNDGGLSLVFTNQIGGTNIYCVPIPSDPYLSPWPGLELIAEKMFEPNPDQRWNPEKIQPEEGLAVGDIDGDGKVELVCGTHWYKYTGDPCQAWAKHRFTSGYLTTKVAIADVDGDGRQEILLSEGDPVIYGRKAGGRLAWFKPGAEITALWREHVIEDGLLDAHTLQAADLCGNGRMDLLVGEIGEAGEDDRYITHPPRLMIYENLGRGEFKRHILDEGTGIHDGLLADFDNRGVLDIFGKPLHGPEKWNIHIYFRQVS